MPTGSTVFLVFTGVVTFAVVLQTIILFAVLAAGKMAQKKAEEQIEQLREDIRPFLATASRVAEAVEDMTPRLRAITVNVHTATERLRDQVGNIDAVVGDVTGKTRRQVTRIDNMVTDTLDAIAHGTRVVQDNVMSPLRQVGGWMSAIRTGMDMFRPGERRRSRSDMRSDEDFI
jgi:methyl-accepting chemotaxis protein